MTAYCLLGAPLDGGVLDDLAAGPRIGIDTEFMRERTYFAQLCLLQVATADALYCIDPLATSSSDDGLGAAFWQALAAPEWVVHAGRQDLEVIFQSAGVLPRSLFDTQIAAALLGLEPQIGYANLVSQLFGVELDKTHTRADWSRRPLRPELLEYAAEDVEYLLPARDELASRLAGLGRLQWALEDSADLVDPALYRPEPALAIDRLKGARKLCGRARAAARALAAWRETEALRADRPRQWILRDAVLIEIAVGRPGSRTALSRIDGMAEKTVRRAGGTILDILEKAVDEQDYEPPSRPTEAQKSTLKTMQRRVAEVAARLGVAAEVLAPRKELSAAMLGGRDLRIFRGWRREQFGERLLELLESG